MQPPVGRPVTQGPNYQQPPAFAYGQQQMPMQPTMQPTMQPPSVLNYANNREVPTAITCHNCRGSVTTTMVKQPGRVTFAWALILGMSCGLCCVPFFVDGCQDKVHFCPRCGVEAGKKHARMC